MATTKTYARASQFIKGLGENLDKIEGKDMLLWGFDIEEGRQFGDKENTLVTMTLSTMDDEDTKVLFHAWSDSLADRLRELSANNVALPVVVAFERAQTSRGYRVWTVK